MRDRRPAPTTQSAGHEGDRDDHRDEDDTDAGHADGPHDRSLEDEQATEGDRDREPGEEDGAAGRRHRPLGGVGDLLTRGDPVLPVTELLAEPAHREQAVVDGEPEAQQGHDVDDGRVELDGVRETEEGQQGPADRHDRPDDRHARRDEAAEDEEHHEKREGQGDALTSQQVSLDGARDRLDHLARAADRALGAHGRRHREHLLLGLRLGLGLGGFGETRLEVDDGDEPSGGGTPTFEERRHRRIREATRRQQWRADVLDAWDAGDLARRGRALVHRCRIREVGTGHLHRQGLEGGLALGDDVLGARRLRLDGRGAGVQSFEEGLAGDTADRDDEARDRDDGPGRHPAARVARDDTAETGQTGARRRARG